jgi:hypothetical protein
MEPEKAVAVPSDVCEVPELVAVVKPRVLESLVVLRTNATSAEMVNFKVPALYETLHVAPVAVVFKAVCSAVATFAYVYGAVGIVGRTIVPVWPA